LLSPVDDSFEDWSEWLPFDRVRIGVQPRDDVPATADRVAASKDGWTIEWPLPGKTMVAQVGRGTDGVSIPRGRRLRPWVGNVLVLGDSAAALDPLHGYQLELAQTMILLALELLPGREFDPVETEEYNRRAEQLTRRIRDFIALHYLRSGVWPEFASAEPPDSLARTLDQYEYRGRMPFHEEEPVTRDSWTAALLSLGVMPHHVDPQSALVGLDEAVPAMERLVGEIDEAVAGLPEYGDYLARMGR
jgi:tryptophan halogenase